MAACSDGKWLIDMWKLSEGDGNIPAHYALLTFDLKVAADGRVTGEISIGLVKLADVTGTCQPNDNPADGTVLVLTFIWGGIDVFLIGFTYVDGIPRFRGSFIARKHVGVVSEVDERLKTFTGPGSGDTGTGTGQQT